MLLTNHRESFSESSTSAFDISEPTYDDCCAAVGQLNWNLGRMTRKGQYEVGIVRGATGANICVLSFSRTEEPICAGSVGEMIVNLKCMIHLMEADREFGPDSDSSSFSCSV